MNDVAELKQFAIMHARAQSIPRSRTTQLLGRIETDDRGMPRSWVREWCRAGEMLDLRGRMLEASRHYNIARFPYVNGDARQYAQERSISAFDRWRQGQEHIQRLDLDLGGRVRCWTTGLSATDRRPLLLVMGGIVSTKEQWAPVLRQARRLGMAGIVTEMPGVGENTLRYTPESWRMISGILDAVRAQADVAHTYAVALSFSGHLALRCAAADERIRGIVTAGAPVSDFFTDTTWQRGIPRITLDTLAHVTKIPVGDLPSQLPDWALRAEHLTALDIPVCYVTSRRDEIIPGTDVRHLGRHLGHLRVMEHDDLHGSPRHVAQSRLWTALSILQMRGVYNLQRVVVSGLWRTLRTRDRLIRTGARAQSAA
jgi:pimeloyl-ACP methyl ester carboxylesterase